MAKSQYVREATLCLNRLAMDGKTITYKELAVEIGLPASGNYMVSMITSVLSDIYQWHASRNLPKLTSLVVKSSTSHQGGIPGQGFWEIDDNGQLSTREKRTLVNVYHRDVWNYFSVDNGVDRSIERIMEHVTWVDYNWEPMLTEPTVDGTFQCTVMFPGGAIVRHFALSGSKFKQMETALQLTLRRLRFIVENGHGGQDEDVNVAELRKLLGVNIEA